MLIQIKSNISNVPILFYYIFYFSLFQGNISELIRHLKKD